MVLLGLITATLLLGNWGTREEVRGAGTRSDCGVLSIHLAGVAAVIGRIRVYNATGELDITNGPLYLGTRVNLTCKLTRPPNGNEAISYRWYHNCTRTPDNSCGIQNGDSYRVRNDTLSMNVTSHDQAGRYTCAVQYSDNTLIVQAPFISLAG